jgi:hypothetical protein
MCFVRNAVSTFVENKLPCLPESHTWNLYATHKSIATEGLCVKTGIGNCLFRRFSLFLVF